MIENLEYKGFIGHFAFSDQKASYIAKVVNCNDTILCNGRSPNDLKKSFVDCIDLYLEICKLKGIMPNISRIEGN